VSDDIRKAVSDYLKTLEDCRKRGNATEHTYRPALQSFLQEIDSEIVATNEPKRDTPVGAPDFNITRGEVPLGRIETKDIGTNLDEIERGHGPHGEQFLRYIALPNWILTDYLEFRWFVNGRKRLTGRLASIDGKNRLKPAPDVSQQVVELLQAFYHEQAFTVGTAKELAERMAALTRVIRSHILATLPLESESGWLHQWLDAFRSVLLPVLLW
jgi:hypothetical protein